MKQFRYLVGAGAAAALASFALAASANTVVIPDPGPSGSIFFGNGDASVTYDDVTFSTSSAISDGNFFNVGPAFSDAPPVLSSQEQTEGLANILVTLPGDARHFSVNYGTFTGDDVTFALSDGDTFTQGSTGSAYSVPDFFTTAGNTPFTSVLITSADPVMNINDITFSVPEPATWAMLLMGFFGLGALVRSRRAQPALAA